MCACMHAYFRQKIEDLEAERQRLEEQNNILEMRLERHNLQVGTKTFSPTVFRDGFTRLAQRNQFNNPNGSSLARVTLQIDSHKRFPYLTVFQAQLDPGVISALPDGKVGKPVADLNSSFIG